MNPVHTKSESCSYLQRSGAQYRDRTTGTRKPGSHLCSECDLHIDAEAPSQVHPLRPSGHRWEEVRMKAV